MKSQVYFCETCGTELAEDEAILFGHRYYCEQCLDEDTVHCSHCGARVWADDNAGTDRDPLCYRCYENYYTSCEDCGRIIHQDSAHYFDDDDYPYCESCYETRNSSCIKEYNYKPDPIFYGEGERFFGVELEIDEAGKDSDNAECILNAGNVGGKHIYIKSDGSLNHGMEIVTHPMTLNYHKNFMPWEAVCKEAIRLGYKSHKTQTCGLHIHVNRNTFGETREIQDERISRVLYFVEHHWNELLRFSRRTESAMNRWAARYGYKNDPQDIMKNAKNSCNGRYACVNICNWNTVEFRMFRGTLKLNTLIAAIELVDLICHLAITLTDKEIKEISWSSFVAAISADEYSELIQYLKERQLYTNEPVNYEEDD